MWSWQVLSSDHKKRRNNTKKLTDFEQQYVGCENPAALFGFNPGNSSIDWITDYVSNISIAGNKLTTCFTEIVM
jgi:hypothetical protein